MVFLIGVGLVAVLLLWLAWEEELIATRSGVLLSTAFVLAVLGGGAFAAAETPFGIGNGRVPALVGQSVCSGERSLERRGLRWRYKGTEVMQRKASRQDPGSEPSCEDDPIERQWPRPGARLCRGEIVVLQSRCSRTRGCA